MLIHAVIKALRNLLLPQMLKLLMFCLLAYVVAGGAMAWLLGSLLVHFAAAAAPESLFLRMLGTLGGGWLAWFLFPLFYPILVSFFDDYMAEAIEAADYPYLPKAAPPFWPTLAQDALFSAKALLINLLLLPFYLIPLLGWLLYYTVNGYLLGAQFFRMSAGRRVSQGEAQAMIRQERMKITLAGTLVSFCATIPVLNIAAPLLGVAALLHLFHAAGKSGPMTAIEPPRPPL